jgi:S-adenosylmethionine-diacylglycerol 3-amino-3-carboxypropyl transferase
MPFDRPSFAVVREDPSLEYRVLAALPSPASAALVVASGGCTALSLATRFPALHVAAFDQSARQLAHVRAKLAALHLSGLAALGMGTRDAAALHQSGTFEALFRLLRQGVVELIEPDLDARLARDPAALLATLRASPYWSALFATLFADPMLHAMFGPAATQHAVPGSYPGYFRAAFERGLAAEHASSNYFLRHVLAGDYAPGCAPDFFAHAGAAPAIELIEGSLPAVPELARFGLISLSNIFDWSDDALVAAWAGHLTRHGGPGAAVLIRQLNNHRDLRPFFADAFDFDERLGDELLALDRSLFYDRVVVAFRR